MVCSSLSEISSVDNVRLRPERDLKRPDPLRDFLEEVSLVADIDTWDNKSNAVTLMTLHSAKGLEFPAVFIVGLEERLLPHANSMATIEEIEEERRLCYVGITRAMDYLALTYSETRNVRGMSEVRRPSRFLREIVTSGIDIEESSAVAVDDFVEYRPWRV